MRALFVLLAAGAAGTLALFNCSSSDSTAAKDAGADVDPRAPTPAEWDRAVTRPDDQAATTQRAACTFKRGSMPAETLGKSTPVDKDIPIQNIVVIVQENHSFDNYFGRFGKYAGRTDVESAPDNASNPGVAAPASDGGADASMTGDAGASGVPVPYQHNPHLCTLDTNHEWSGTHQEWNSGAMDGFVQANEGWSETGLSKTADPSLLKGDRAMYFYDERDIPFYYDLAKTFAIADHYHASLLGPTWPNRMFVYAATSFGQTSNTLPDISAFPYPQSDATVLDELEKRHVDWNLYTDGVPSAGVVYGTAGASRWDGRRVNTTISDFMSQVAAGTLPSVAFVDAVTSAEGPEGNDEHPPGQIQIGQKFVAGLVQALMKSPQWAHTALFLTWDEHGGYYDHLPPPAACPPDDKAPILEPGDTTKGGFDHYGVRVPLIVVSPYAKKSYVGHATYDHSSITRFIEAKFKIPALTNRDANADALMDMFDFSNPAFATPPSIAAPAISQAEIDYCKANYGK